jgi:hypothetical protein
MRVVEGRVLAHLVARGANGRRARVTIDVTDYTGSQRIRIRENAMSELLRRVGCRQASRAFAAIRYATTAPTTTSPAARAAHRSSPRTRQARAHVARSSRGALHQPDAEPGEGDGLPAGAKIVHLGAVVA